MVFLFQTATGGSIPDKMALFQTRQLPAGKIWNNDSTGVGKFCRYGILWNERNVFTADWPVTFLIITEINYPS